MKKKIKSVQKYTLKKMTYFTEKKKQIEIDNLLKEIAALESNTGLDSSKRDRSELFKTLEFKSVEREKIY